MAREDQLSSGFGDNEPEENRGITLQAFNTASKTIRDLILLTGVFQPPTRMNLDYEFANIAWADTSGIEFIQAEISYDDGSIGYVDIRVTSEEDSPVYGVQRTNHVNLVLTCTGLDDFLQVFQAAYNADIAALERIANEHEQQRLRRIYERDHYGA